MMPLCPPISTGHPIDDGHELHTMLAQVMSLHKEYYGCVELFMPVYNAEQIARIALCEDLLIQIYYIILSIHSNNKRTGTHRENILESWLEQVP